MRIDASSASQRRSTHLIEADCGGLSRYVAVRCRGVCQLPQSIHLNVNVRMYWLKIECRVPFSDAFSAGALRPGCSRKSREFLGRRLNLVTTFQNNSTMAQTKATKKFEKNHLKDTIKRRKEFSKIKQKKQLKEKRKARRAKENAQAGDEDAEEEEDNTVSGAANGKKFADMSVDEFFQGGFVVPEMPTKAEKDKVTGKRKRGDLKEEDVAEAPSSNDAREDGLAKEGQEDESDDEMAGHKQQLEALAKNDPEFYNHLQENDPELLDFTGDDELAGIQLSESEEEGPKAKKQKTGKKGKIDDEDAFGEETSNEVTKEMVKRWHTGMVEHSSLRQMREIIMAFRAAVRSNEDDGKEYKYSISDPDGTKDVFPFCCQAKLSSQSTTSSS